MKFLKINYTYYYLFTAISLVLLLNFNGCRDLQDCRSVYTNVVWIGFKGKDNLEIDKIEYDKPSKNNPYINIAKNLKGDKSSIFLHPKHNMVRVLFHRTPSTPTSKPDTLTIFYKTIPSLLSPHCGLQEEYIIDSVETTFAGSTVIKPALRSQDYESANSEELNKQNIEIHY